jgi:hypothetical protein
MFPREKHPVLRVEDAEGAAETPWCNEVNATRNSTMFLVGFRAHSVRAELIE